MSTEDTMTNQELEAIKSLRSKGYSVVIWSPQELGESNIDNLEDIVIERGNNYIASIGRI